jgi:two-component system, cell cycle response regulator DivK
MNTRRSPLVLVVDDYPDAREMYADLLSTSGYEVAECEDGLSALQKAYELRPDVILMDLSLPRLHGGEVTRRLKQDDRTKHIPVLVLSGFSDSDFTPSNRPPCDGFLSKPCMPNELLQAVEKMLAPQAQL